MLNEWRVETVIAKSLFVVFWNMNFLQDLIATNYITPSTTTGEAVYDRVARVIYPIQEVIGKKKIHGLLSGHGHWCMPITM